MNRISALIMLLFSFHALADSHPEVKTKLNYVEDAEYFASKVGTRYLKFVIEDVTFPKGSQKAKFEKALAMMEEVMNSEEFKTRVIGYTRRGERSYQKNYIWTDSSKLLSNEDIYEVIMNGDEKMRPGTPGEMNFNSWVKQCNVFQSVTTWCRKVIGSTDPYSSSMIRLNWKFYKSFETPDMVANMVHEWIHLLGFLHGSTRLDEEVPYVVGDIAGEVAREFLKREKGAY